MFITELENWAKENTCEALGLNAYVQNSRACQQPQGKLTRHVLENSVYNKGKPLAINPFGGANKFYFKHNYKVLGFHFQKTI